MYLNIFPKIFGNEKKIMEEFLFSTQISDVPLIPKKTQLV